MVGILYAASSAANTDLHTLGEPGATAPEDLRSPETIGPLAAVEEVCLTPVSSANEAGSAGGDASLGESCEADCRAERDLCFQELPRPLCVAIYRFCLEWCS